MDVGDVGLIKNWIIGDGIGGEATQPTFDGVDNGAEHP